MSLDPDTPSTPASLLDAAGQAVRAFNHRTRRPFRPDQDGWQYVPDLYDCLGELAYLAGLLPQVIEQMDAAMHAHLDAGYVGVDHGSEYDGHPEKAIANASDALAHAVYAAQTLRQAFATAQTTLSRAHYNGPDING